MFLFVSLLVALSMTLAACKPTVTEQPAVETQAPIVTEAPVVPTTTRKGGWADTLVFTSIDEMADAVAQLQADSIDLYNYGGEDADTFEIVKNDPNLAYTLNYGGSVDGYMFNSTGPTFNDGRLNPFSNPKVREAMHWLTDREYLAQEAVGALGSPMYTVLPSSFADYVRYIDLIRPLEAKYAYDFEKGKAAITAEMEAMGATMGADGKWQFDGSPVVLIALIRSEDEREFIGNYISDQLEKVGFTVDRQVRTRSELSPIWGRSVTADGEWHFYTGGWGYSQIVRNGANLFDGYYNPRGGSTTCEAAYEPSPEFDKVSMDLANNTYKTMEERREMFAKALEYSMQEAQVVWTTNISSAFPRQKDIVVASDLVAGVGIAAMYPFTLRIDGQEGGTIRMATSGLLTGAWNPAFGQNWVQETTVQYNLMDNAVLPDPYTGLYLPQRLEKAEIVAQEGLPMTKTLDWIDLQFVPEIPVPADAWAEWDATAQKFITTGERFPEGTTALTKTTITYPSSLWETKWHDGSPLSPADFVLQMIWSFDPAKPESPYYDAAAVPNYESTITFFKGVKIVSTDPLVIETYLDLYDLDAESMIGGYWPTGNWYPINIINAYSPFSWHAFTLGALAQQNKELGFSEDSSTEMGVTWTHYIDGPSLEILKKYLDQAEAEAFIPYAPTLGEYITADEAKARYANLQTWYADHNHFWVGTGPYYLDQVNSVEGSIVLQNNPDFPDLADKWSRFSEAKMPVLDASGPGQVTIGQEAAFDALVSFKDAPYAAADMEGVTFLLYDADGALVDKGQAELVTDGQYAIKLTAEMTAKLKEGASRIEVIGVSRVVGVPAFTTVTFVAAP
jgi:peptide/nickel transport system substrate-binding protein